MNDNLHYVLETEPVKRTCEVCEYWSREEGNVDLNCGRPIMGGCRRHPPVYDQGNAHIAYFPRTSQHMWCGEFIRRGAETA